MLKNIRLHIETDDSKQQALEEKLAQHISETHEKNINAFQRQIPSLLPLLKNTSSQNISIFCNKFGEYNIVDYGLGRTLYGFHPKQEIEKQVENFKQHCPIICLKENTTKQEDKSQLQHVSQLEALPSYNKWKKYEPIPQGIDCLVVLGCGLGLHLLQLIEKVNIRHIIVYEPEEQYFLCSSLALNWKTLLDTAKAKETGLYLQIGKDGRNLIQDVEELQQHFNIDHFFLYQHYNHTVFNAISKQLVSDSWSNVKKKGFSFSLNESFMSYCPPWTPPFSLDHYQDVKMSEKRLEKNLEAFKRYFPKIHEKFHNYTPKIWLPIESNNGEINLVKKDSLTNWYGDNPVLESQQNFCDFSNRPNKDGLVLGYTGTKLAHYLHYKFVKKTEKLIEEEEEQLPLPDNIQSTIVFGLGAGYQLELLLQKHKVDNLFVCEPNPDFFYASLHAIDWHQILESIDKEETRIYLNVGDGGGTLFRDLLNQFYAIGPYILSNTYFYQCYYNAELNQTIGQLREQLRIVIMMGEYFDHAYYGISHTTEIIKRETPLLSPNPSRKLTLDDKETPIILIGNGPSLDSSIDVIKELQDQAILITCGTSLQVMQRNGITPDFHAEIEQNRSTYDWAVLIDDLDYLKNISLISCNGIHPDTCDLYKDVYVAFKEGESSTVSALNILGDENVERLSFSFPTVANFACNIVAKLGFENVYLIGIDLGFIDSKHHHSVQSSYYKDDGEECYDYSDRNNTSLVVPGNFRPTVNTKHEFKISKQIIEQLLVSVKKETTFYNCSDGAKIFGAQPLTLDNILVTTNPEQKQNCLKTIKNEVFFKPDVDAYFDSYTQKYDPKVLATEMGVLNKLINQEISTNKDVSNLINKQRELLFLSYQNKKSLLFYFLYGTVNYANAILSKLTQNSNKESIISSGTQEGLRLWRNSFSEIKTMICANDSEYDVSCRYISKREKLLDRTVFRDKKVLVLTNSLAFMKCIKHTIDNSFGETAEVLYKPFSTVKLLRNEEFDIVIYHRVKSFGECEIFENILSGEVAPIKGKESTVVVIYNNEAEQVRSLQTKTSDVKFLAALIDDDDFQKSQIGFTNMHTSYYAISVSLQKYNCDLILMKYRPVEDYNKALYQSYVDFEFLDDDIVSNYTWYMTVNFNGKQIEHHVPTNGTRGGLVHDISEAKSRIAVVCDKSVFAKVINNQTTAVPELLKDRPFV